MITSFVYKYTQIFVSIQILLIFNLIGLHMLLVFVWIFVDFYFVELISDVGRRRNSIIFYWLWYLSVSQKAHCKEETKSCLTLHFRGPIFSENVKFGFGVRFWVVLFPLWTRAPEGCDSMSKGSNFCTNFKPRRRIFWPGPAIRRVRKKARHVGTCQAENEALCLISSQRSCRWSAACPGIRRLASSGRLPSGRPPAASTPRRLRSGPSRRRHPPA